MPSISTSDNTNLIEVDRLHLIFSTSIYRPWTLRELFTRSTQAPLDLLATNKDRVHVASDISFVVGRGEIVGLIGINGSGKTSLCRCIAGMYVPTQGNVRVMGQVRAIFDTGIGIQPELTGRENAHLLSHLLYPEDKRRADLVDDALEFSGLGRFIDVPYKVYSNGMQTRLCLSLLSAKPADILILDEVFDGADTFFKNKIAERIKDLIKNSGAVLFVSHSPAQLRDVCTRAIVLNQGKLAFDGTVDAALAFYSTLGPVPDSGAHS